MFGTNTQLPIEKGDGSFLKVTSIFATFQGEGPYVGHPCVFIRLSGCNLACSFCDTEFDEYNHFSIEEIINKIIELWREFSCRNEDSLKNLYKDNHDEEKKMNQMKELDCKGNTDNFYIDIIRDNNKKNIPSLIVITGGEPMRQNINKLCEVLFALGVLTVQVETNGTIWRPTLEKIQFVCSPKIVHGKYYPIRDEILKQTIAIKFLVSLYQVGYSDIYQVGQDNYKIPVYIQPIDHYDQEKNTANIKLAMSLAAHYNCRISIQMHKVIGIE